MDPAEFRRRNLIPDDAYPYTATAGLKFEKLSHHQCLDKLLTMMRYRKLRAEQAELRQNGRVPRHRACRDDRGDESVARVLWRRRRAHHRSGWRDDAARSDGHGNGGVGDHEQGQGTEAILAQIAATAVGLPIEHVRVVTGDTGVTPYGGGTWASRGAGIGGEAVLQAGKVLRANILEIAAAILKESAEMLDLRTAT